MKRRDFHFRAGAVAATWLGALGRAAHAQPARVPLIGFLNGGSLAPFAHLVAGFRDGLAQTGWVEGRSVAIDYRWAEGHYERLPEQAAELVQCKVDLLAATGGENSALAAKQATAQIPIVFAIGGHPVDLGLVASLPRPGANLTGLTQYTGPLESKRLGLLRELLPGARSVGVLVNPRYANAPAQIADLKDGARRLGVAIVTQAASQESELGPAFAAFARQRVDGLVVGSDPFFNTRRDRLVALAAQYALATVYEFIEFARAGGLMSYGANLADGYRQIGVYAGRILHGARPSELPVLQPARFEFVINLKTARALGIAIPQSLLLRADEVIE